MPTLKSCPRKKSDMTPCVVTDGAICYTLDSYGYPICVGCERGIHITGVPVDIEKLKRELDAYIR